MSSQDITVFCTNPKATKAKGGLNLTDIVQELKKRDLPTSGQRSVVAARLCDAIAKQKSPTKPIPVPRPKSSFKPIPAPRNPFVSIHDRDERDYLSNIKDQFKIIT